MARIESTVGERIFHFPGGVDGRQEWKVPASRSEGALRTNGVAEIPDAVVDGACKADPIVAGWFASGELIDMRKVAAAAAPAAATAPTPPAPSAPAAPVTPEAPAKDDASTGDKVAKDKASKK